MSLNLSHVFVRYPDFRGAAQAAATRLSAPGPEGAAIPRHAVVSTGGPWLGVYAWGNDTPPALAQYLSRALEAEALWFGLAGRSLAYRVQRFRLGRRVEETTEPRELFAAEGDHPLPDYPDAERAVFDWLGAAGIPEAYRFLHAEELGMDSGRAPDAVRLEPSGGTVYEEEFAHRPPRPVAAGIRTLFDRFDDNEKFVEDELVLRGRYDPDRAGRLLERLQQIARRRTVPEGWTFRYAAQGPPDVLEGLAGLFSKERSRKKWIYEVTAAGP